MTKLKLLWIFVIVLLVINIGLITALILGKPPGPFAFGKRPKHAIINRLNLDEQQVADYEKLIEKHKNIISQKEEAFRLVRRELFSLLAQEDLSARDSLVQQLAQIQAEIEETHFVHFQGIKYLCREDQLPAFKALTVDLSKLFGLAKHVPPGPKRKS